MMETRRVRSIALAVVVGCLALGGALAANVALLGVADQSQDHVGRLQLRLATPHGPHQATTVRPPAIVEASPPPLPVADDETGADD